jgi:predicted AAA+ superfamily ATPase
MFRRHLEPRLRARVDQPYVQILFGARQTGKSTLLRALFPTPDIALDFSDPGLRSAYLVRPQTLIERCRALAPSKPAPIVVIDEAQAVPAIFDAVQHLYDSDKDRWRFVLCGSSARKLRATGANLLPGRSLLHELHPLTLAERPGRPVGRAPKLAFRVPVAVESLPAPRFPATGLVERLVFGDLPGVVLADEKIRPALLASYAQVHLQEEIRREALVKDWPAFVRFLELAAVESGGIVDYARVARHAGISPPTAKTYYQLLEDMFVGFTVPGFSGSPRKRLLSTPRFFFFDLGVRHAAAGLAPSQATVLANPGPIFEQWMILELHRRCRYLGNGRLSHYRTKGGAEIDCILTLDGRHYPIEAKWTDHPDASDARHVASFLAEHGKRAPYGFIVCRAPHPLQIAPNVLALPWQLL